jgi:hypothetical protein
MVTDVDFYFVQEPPIFYSFHQSASFDVLFSSSENNMHAIRSYIFYTELLDYYEAGAGNTAWISSVCLFLFMGLGIFSLCTICA